MIILFSFLILIGTLALMLLIYLKISDYTDNLISKLETNLTILNIIKNKLESICQDEQVLVKFISYEEMNKNNKNPDEYAVGQYRYIQSNNEEGIKTQVRLKMYEKDIRKNPELYNVDRLTLRFDPSGRGIEVPLKNSSLL